MTSIDKKLKGHFITLEGGEGSGKSTLLIQLKDILIQRGCEIVITQEPGGTALGNCIRKWLLQSLNEVELSPLTELFLFLSARAQHIKEIIVPALASGKIVICDRFNDSTLAYQGIARNLDIKMVKKLCQLACNNIQPQLTLFLDVDPQVGLNRSKVLDKNESKAGSLDRIESETIVFHLNVQKAFQSIAAKEPLRVYTIDANQAPEDVTKEAIKAIEELILFPHFKND